jgi:hypothetical protein
LLGKTRVRETEEEAGEKGKGYPLPPVFSGSVDSTGLCVR